jgi:preprotein translocase subunit SecG
MKRYIAVLSVVIMICSIVMYVIYNHVLEFGDVCDGDIGWLGDWR